MTHPVARPPDDPRKYRARIDRELIAGGLAIVIVVGGGLIWLLWGLSSLLGALLIFAGVLGLVLLIVLILKLLGWSARERG